LAAIKKTDLVTADSAFGRMNWPKGACALCVALDIASNLTPSSNVTYSSVLQFGWATCGHPEAVTGFHPDAAAAAAEAARRTASVRAAFLAFEHNFVEFGRLHKDKLVAAAALTAVVAAFSFACNIYLMCYWKPDPRQSVAQAMSALADALHQDMGNEAAAAAAAVDAEEARRRRKKERRKQKKKEKRQRAAGARGGMMI